MKNIDNLREFFQEDKFVVENGIEIDSVDSERAVCSAKISKNHLNADGVVQGGMIFTIADFAFGVLANYLHNRTVTQSATITYIAPLLCCKKIFAESKEIAFSKHNCIHEVKVFDGNKKIYAVLQINGFIK